MKKHLFLLLLSLSVSFLLYTCVPLESTGGQSQTGGAQSQTGAAKAKTIEKEFVTDDYIYEDGIKTVLLYPFTFTNDPSKVGSPPALQPAILPLSQTDPFLLEFDEM